MIIIVGMAVVDFIHKENALLVQKSDLNIWRDIK